MPEEYVPPVVAVVVTAEADTWLEPCLESLGQQDYPSLDVLVIDTGTSDGVTNRVAGVMPSAFVRRRPEAGSFAAAANDVLVGIEGASFFLFCHDDVALAPGCVRLMVEEAFRSNAGIVGPKLVDWDAPDRLLQIGLGVSRFGASVPRIQEGELDQSQHDEAREVFAVPSACLLSRVDLFAAVGGFDAEISEGGEDVDLCWRAQLAGARVVTAPRAIVRHRRAAAVAIGLPDGDELVVRRRNELRAVLKNYGLVRRWLTSFQLLLLTLLDSLTAPLTDRRARARAERAAWTWNFAHRRSLSEARRRVREVRQVGDRAVAKRMATRHRLHRLPLAARGEGVSLRRGGARRGPQEVAITSDGRSGRGERQPEVDKLTEWLVRVQHGEMQVGQVIAAVVIGLLMILGTRELLVGRLPVVGDLVPGPSAVHLLAQWITGRSDPGWRPTQVGPPAYGLVGLVGTILGNSSGVALRVAFLSGLVVGTIGTWRVVRDFGSARACIVAAVVFAASPLVWNGLAHGDVEASVALAGLPFVLGRLARASGLRPFLPAHGGASRGWGGRDLVADVAPLGLLLAAMSSLAPAVVLDVGVLVVASLGASIVVGGARALLRSAAVGFGGLVVAFLCCMPWSITWLQSGARWSLFAGSVPPAGAGSSPADLLRGHTGPVGGWWGAAGLVAFAAFAFVWARGPRLAWAARWWVCALGSVLLAWAGSEGWLGAGGGGTEVLVAPAAVALAACCGIGTAAFELDLRRHRFGWRQITGVVAVACLAVGIAPALGALLGGRADLPGIGFDETAGEFTTSSPPGARVLWIGDPRALPGAAFQVGSGLAAFVTTSGLPSMATLWPTADPGPASWVTADVGIAMTGRTLRLGALLASKGIRYVVVPTASAPTLIGVQTPPATLPPPVLLRALEAQTDLRQLPNEDGVLVWANAVWTPADGAGTLLRPGATAGGALRACGIAGALLVILGCIVEGVVRRRAPRRRLMEAEGAGAEGAGAEGAGTVGAGTEGAGAKTAPVVPGAPGLEVAVGSAPPGAPGASGENPEDSSAGETVLVDAREPEHPPEQGPEHPHEQAPEHPHEQAPERPPGEAAEGDGSPPAGRTSSEEAPSADGSLISAEESGRT
ncbi:MAG TPA: glycosyltransferase [Acidimicrobiales bacterium]|nr:glycosyltransferase [Acidimicrobiales bacterium]